MEIFWGYLNGGASSGIYDRNKILIRQGEVVAGETLTFVGCGCIDNHGDIVFEGSYSAGDGIFKRPIGGGAGELVVAPGDTIDGKTILSAWMPATNEQGHVVFHGQYAEDGQNRIALFTPDELLVAAGDVIDGKVIEHFPHIASEGLNDAGLLGFVARFHDQRSSAPGRGLFTIDLVSGVKRLFAPVGRRRGRSDPGAGSTRHPCSTTAGRWCSPPRTPTTSGTSSPMT